MYVKLECFKRKWSTDYDYDYECKADQCIVVHKLSTNRLYIVKVRTCHWNNCQLEIWKADV